jgi:hypothetical protein
MAFIETDAAVRNIARFHPIPVVGQFWLAKSIRITYGSLMTTTIPSTNEFLKNDFRIRGHRAKNKTRDCGEAAYIAAKVFRLIAVSG